MIKKKDKCKPTMFAINPSTIHRLDYLRSKEIPIMTRSAKVRELIQQRWKEVRVKEELQKARIKAKLDD